MIDFEEARDVFRQRIDDAGIFGDAIQWENKTLQASEKGELWLSESYLPITEQFATVTSDMLEGILQYNINIPVNLASREKTATDAVKALGNLFSTAEVIETATSKTSVGTPKRSFQGKLDNAWYTIVVDIDLKQYEN